MQFKTEKYKPLLHWLQIIFFAVAILYFGKALFVPLSFSLLIALVLYPSCMWLEKRCWPRSLALAMLLFLVIIKVNGQPCGEQLEFASSHNE